MSSLERFASLRVQISHPNRNWLSVEAAETKRAVAELDRAAPSSTPATNLKMLIFWHDICQPTSCDSLVLED
jgi:hypothetical protein